MRFKFKKSSRARTFKRVIRSYTWQEKFISLGLVFLVAYLGGDYVVQKFTGGVGDSSTFASGRYSEGIVGQFQRINPLFVDINTADRAVSNLVFSGLVKYSPETGRMRADIGRLELSEDGKVYTFDLRDDVKWHDGESLDIDDVFFTYHDVIQNPDFPNQILKANFEGVEIKKTDDGKIQFVLPKVNSFFIANLNIGILPEHIFRDVPVQDIFTHDFNRNPIGSGPYEVEEAYEKFSDGRMEIMLEAFEGYYGEKPKIGEIRLVGFTDYESLIEGKNVLNAMDKVLGNLRSEFEGDDRLTLYSYELPQYTALFLNQDAAVFKKEKVRLALQKSLDKAKLLEGIGDSKAVDTPLMQLSQGEWLYQPNVEEARGALYDSSYRYENDGEPFRKDSDGNELEVKLLARQFPEGTVKYEEIKKVVEFVQKSWEDIGVKVNLELLPEGEYNAALQTRGYDVALAGQSLGYNLDTYSFWHSSQAETGLNLSNYRSFAADKLIEQIREINDGEAKEKKLNELAKLIADEVPAIFLYRPTYFYVSDEKVKTSKIDNLVFPSDKFADISLWDWQ